MSLAESSLKQQAGRNAVEDDVYDDGLLRVEHQNYYASCAGQPIRLPRTEFLILSRLARTPERIVTAEELWVYAWGTGKPLNAESLHVYIYRLRHKLPPHQLRIDTMVNVGYRLVIERVSS
ncbi:MAG TPA: winged helix-turn-helix domain-containing protein [Pyrinomonadaceae bacterium]